MLAYHWLAGRAVFSQSQCHQLCSQTIRRISKGQKRAKAALQSKRYAHNSAFAGKTPFQCINGKMLARVQTFFQPDL